MRIVYITRYYFKEEIPVEVGVSVVVQRNSPIGSERSPVFKATTVDEAATMATDVGNWITADIIKVTTNRAAQIANNGIKAVFESLANEFVFHVDIP
jgi:hypothetical protein